LFASLAQNLNIWSLPAESGQAKVTGAPQRLIQEAANDSWPEISADGAKFVYRSDRAGTSDVWFKDPTTGSERRLTVGVSLFYGPCIDAGGATIAYSTRENQKRPAYVVKTRTGVPQKVCDDCGLLWQLSADGTFATYTTYSPQTVSTPFLLDAVSGQKYELGRHDRNILDPRLSPDGRWISFHVQNRLETRQIFIAPVRDRKIAGDWIPITDGEGLDRNADWSPDGNVLYYQSEREGFRCIWARRLDPGTKRPLGPPIPIFHAHHANLSLAGADPAAVGPSIARDKIVFSQTEIAGNIWMAQLEGQK
jgi:Tol biopolymer transport system component